MKENSLNEVTPARRLSTLPTVTKKSQTSKIDTPLLVGVGLGILTLGFVWLNADYINKNINLNLN